MKFRPNLFAALLLTLCALLSGCEGGKPVSLAKEEPVSLAVVAGIHSNAGVISLNSTSLYQAVYDACASYGAVTLIRCDGAPEAYFQTPIDPPDVKGLSKNRLHTRAQSYTEQILAQLDDAAAVTGELDTLQALRLAGQALSAAGGQREVLVLDTGLSTRGLDFTNGLLEAEPEAVVSALREANALPDLEGASVPWSYLGQVADPQEPLTPAQEKNLEAIWRQVLLASGAAEVTFTSDFAGGTANTGLPAVSLVETDTWTLSLDVPQLDQTRVAFVGDTARFLDEEAAGQAILEVASYLEEHPSLEVYVVGTTASGDEAVCRDLSRQRAQAVCRVLTEYGVAESRLTALGLGFSDPWHVEDRDTSGALAEDLARQNRKVLILDQNSPEAGLLALYLL